MQAGVGISAERAVAEAMAGDTVEEEGDERHKSFEQERPEQNYEFF